MSQNCGKWASIRVIHEPLKMLITDDLRVGWVGDKNLARVESTHGGLAASRSGVGNFGEATKKRGIHKFPRIFARIIELLGNHRFFLLFVLRFPSFAACGHRRAYHRITLSVVLRSGEP